MLVVVAVAGVAWRAAGSPTPWRASADRTVAAARLSAPSQLRLPPPETFAAVFAPCAHCHEIGPGARAMTGPPLTGVIGRRAASLPDYPYSEALRASGLVWDAKTLARFIADPQAVAPGSRMIFAGLPQNEIDALVSYIETVGAQDAAAKTLPSSALAIGGPFTLVDTHDAVVTERDFLGKPSAIFFGYTHCPDICPTTLLDLTELMKAMGADADRLNVAFVTVDPGRDTPAQLADYLSSFDPRIRGLTGTEAQIAAAAKAYHVVLRARAGRRRRLFHGSYGLGLSDERRRRIRRHDELRGRRQDFARQTRTAGEAGEYGHRVTVTAIVASPDCGDRLPIAWFRTRRLARGFLDRRRLASLRRPTAPKNRSSIA